MNILEELWYGNIDPMEAVGCGGFYYKGLMGLMAKNRKKIVAKLDEDMQDVLETYDDNIREIDSIAEKEAFHMVHRVNEKTPKCFLWHTSDDNAVNVKNSLLFCEQFRNYQIPFELHVFPHGAHGLGLGERHWGPLAVE